MAFPLFFLTGSEFYNLAAPSCRSAIKRLQDLGHDIGLHFDASAHPARPDALVEAVNRECEWIENITGSPVDVFSLHRPHPDLLENTLTVPGRINAYAPGLFHDIGYVSDSRGAWHHGPPLDHKPVAAGRALQLLTHPIWWTSDPTNIFTLEHSEVYRGGTAWGSFTDAYHWRYRSKLGIDQK